MNYNPKPVRGRSSSYHYNREKKGEPTRYLLAREAMEKALLQCTNTADLRYTLAKLGYELTMNDRRKYWTITPKGCKKPIRLVKLSADYTPEGIRHRLVNNRYDRPPRIDDQSNTSCLLAAIGYFKGQAEYTEYICIMRSGLA